MQMNRYSSRRPAFSRRTAAALLAFVLAAVIFAGHPYIAYAEAAEPENMPSSSDAPPAPDLPEGTPADFTRVVSVPVNVYIPDFYQQVVNVSGMYIFTMPDGTICKRIYGAINEEFGWYEPVGRDNIVYVGSPMIDPAEDMRMYYEALSQAELDAMERQDYSGILPPDSHVTEVEEVQGVSVMDLTFYCVGGAVLLCLIITIGASVLRSREPSDPRFR